VRQMDFHCGRCGSTMTIIFEDGKFHAPEKCSTTHCRGRAFDPIRSSAVTVDWQKIRSISFSCLAAFGASVLTTNGAAQSTGADGNRK
jgi:hypothetical protein